MAAARLVLRGPTRSQEAFLIHVKPPRATILCETSPGSLFQRSLVWGCQTPLGLMITGHHAMMSCSFSTWYPLHFFPAAPNLAHSSICWTDYVFVAMDHIIHPGHFKHVVNYSSPATQTTNRTPHGR